MRKLSTVICSVLIGMLLLVGCKKAIFEILIQTDRNSYSPTSSSVRGIYMYPELKTSSKGTVIEYYWTTTAGCFIGGNDKELNDKVIGDHIMWNPMSDKSPSAPTTATITLIAKEKGTGKILGTTNLTITGNNSGYIVNR